MVNYEEVWDTDIVIIQNLYEEGQSSVKWNGAIGEWFTVMTGVRNFVDRDQRVTTKLNRQRNAEKA